MKAYRVYLCPPPNPPLVTPHTECSHYTEHTPCPVGYMEWHEWAARMARSHRQKKCQYCKRWAIWVLK